MKKRIITITALALLITTSALAAGGYWATLPGIWNGWIGVGPKPPEAVMVRPPVQVWVAPTRFGGWDDGVVQPPIRTHRQVAENLAAR